MAQDLGHDSLEQIQNHVEQYIGKVDRVFHELVSDIIHVDILIVEPTRDKNYYSLVTSGMSDKPMNVSPEQSSPYIELLLNLPSDWKLGQEDFKDENNYWPVRLLKSLARFPHLYNTFLGYGHTVQNGNYDNYASNTKFSGSVLLPMFDDGERELNISPAKTIEFFTVLPLYEKEVKFSLEQGTTAFFNKLIEHDFSTIIDTNRKSYV